MKGQEPNEGPDAGGTLARTAKTKRMRKESKGPLFETFKETPMKEFQEGLARHGLKWKEFGWLV